MNNHNETTNNSHTSELQCGIRGPKFSILTLDNTLREREFLALFTALGQ